MLRRLSTSFGLIWRAVAIPRKVAGGTWPIGFVLYFVYAALGYSFSAGEKVFRFYFPIPGPLMPLELTFPQTVVAVLTLLTFVGALIWHYGSLEKRVHPKLAVTFDPNDPTCRQRYQPDEKSPVPYEAIRLRIDNTSEAETIDNVRVYVIAHLPDEKLFEPREHLEMMGGTTENGVSIDPGVPAYAELLGIIYPERNAQPVVRARYFRMGSASVLQRRLPCGSWELTIRASGRGVKWTDQKYRLTISEHRTNPVELATVGSPYSAPAFLGLRRRFGIGVSES